MAVGPCSVEFRESLTCFHNSTADPKGSDCLEQFREMNECMARYPALYKKTDEEEERALEGLDEDDEESLNSLSNAPASTSETVTETSKSEK
ncbi:mitochondrial intermembrane space import and assembly protein 40-B-like [Stegodyphus dumicola]|uniref:mitochondrial intermembrane space import and assembly protein 40-B-like n=1 Tax=Stegodyphus dumicola TaxID=202533 RepID=UPI0015AB0DB4|nr:mitochondrial intermembrane space import and assembly protein 40-B-like [Stegodyphus dumicola]